MKKLLVMLWGVMLLAASGCCTSQECRLTMEKNAVLLDVRTPEEYRAGHLRGAVNLPLAKVETGATAVVPDKETPLYVYCRGGRQAAEATGKLLKQGYTRVCNLGAMKNAGKRLQLPTEK